MVAGILKQGNAARALTALFVCLFVAACDIPQVTTTPGTGTRTSSDPVNVALLVPSGSGVAELDTIAASLERAARLAAADLNGVSVNLSVYSTQRNSAVAVAAATQAVSEGADIILGPLDGDSAAAVGLALRQANTNVLAFSNNTAVAGGNVYLLGQTFEDSARRVAQYASGQGKSRILIVHANTVAGEAGRAAVTRAVVQNGLAIAGTSSYDNSLTGISSASASIRSTARSGGADAIFLTSNTAGALPVLADILPEAGLGPDTIQYLGLSRWDLDPRLFTLAGVQGGWFAMPDVARQQAFSARYSAANGSAPHPLAFTAYDGIAIIGALWAQGGANPLGGAAITRSQGFQGATGIVRLRPNGTNERGLSIGSIQGGQLVTLDAAPQSFGSAGL
ncbi:MAG: penicillin-binding protein activator [Pseudomonadota bacterium]